MHDVTGTAWELVFVPDWADVSGLEEDPVVTLPGPVLEEGPDAEPCDTEPPGVELLVPERPEDEPEVAVGRLLDIIPLESTLPDTVAASDSESVMEVIPAVELEGPDDGHWSICSISSLSAPV